MKENKDSEYAKRYDTKRKKKSYLLAFYMDDDRERAIYEQLSEAPNRKQLILELLEKHFK